MVDIYPYAKIDFIYTLAALIEILSTKHMTLFISQPSNFLIYAMAVDKLIRIPIECRYDSATNQTNATHTRIQFSVAFDLFFQFAFNILYWCIA